MNQKNERIYRALIHIKLYLRSYYKNYTHQTNSFFIQVYFQASFHIFLLCYPSFWTIFIVRMNDNNICHSFSINYRSSSLEIRRIRIQCDVCWTDHIIKLIFQIIFSPFIIRYFHIIKVVMDSISHGKFKVYSDLFYSYFFNLFTPLVIILNNLLRPIFNPTSFFTDVFHTRSVIDHWKLEEWEYSKLIQIYFISLLCYSSF